MQCRLILINNIHLIFNLHSFTSNMSKKDTTQRVLEVILPCTDTGSEGEEGDDSKYEGEDEPDL